MGWRKKPRSTKQQDRVGLVKAQLNKIGLKMSLEQDPVSGQEVYTFDSIRGGMDNREVLYRIHHAAQILRAGKRNETKGTVAAATHVENGKSDQDEGLARTMTEEPIGNSSGSENGCEESTEADNGIAQS